MPHIVLICLFICSCACLDLFFGFSSSKVFTCVYVNASTQLRSGVQGGMGVFGSFLSGTMAETILHLGVDFYTDDILGESLAGLACHVLLTLTCRSLLFVVWSPYKLI